MSSRFVVRRAILAAALAAVGGLPLPVLAADAKPAGKKSKPKVEVVFCLDTTGSMGGLIEGAKQKIWSICNQIAGGKPTPDLKIGLVAYRDRGDAYVTKVIDLTDDLDAIHGKLHEFQAEGGGDAPESVNQALDDSVNKIKWSTDKKTLRIIFLVGDAPPHMDYTDDVKYPDTCKKACEKGIIINTIQCGNDARMPEALEGDLQTRGRLLRPDRPGRRRGGRRHALRHRPGQDQRRAGHVDAGLRQDRHAKGRRGRRRRKLAPETGSAAADRAGFAAKDGKAAAYDLLDAIKAGKVKLEELKKDELPERDEEVGCQGAARSISTSSRNAAPS